MTDRPPNPPIIPPNVQIFERHPKGDRLITLVEERSALPATDGSGGRSVRHWAVTYSDDETVHVLNVQHIYWMENSDGRLHPFGEASPPTWTRGV